MGDVMAKDNDQEQDSKDIDVEAIFAYYRVDKETAEVMAEIRQRAKDLAHLIQFHCQDSFVAGTCITHIQDAVFHANARIARNNGVRQ